MRTFHSLLAGAGQSRSLLSRVVSKGVLVLLAFSPLLLPACGSGQLAVVDIAYRQHGDGSAVKAVSAIYVDSDGAPWQATHAAGISASVAPDDRMAMSLCQVVDGGTRGGSTTDYRALDLGSVTIESGEAQVALARLELKSGEGVAYRSEPDVNALPYTEGRDYIFRATGSQQAPSFAARVSAPPTFEVEMIGHVTAGAGTIPIPRSQDLRISWSPGGHDGEMFITLVTSNQGLVCRVPDDGEFTISRGHVSDMYSGRGDLVLERYNQTKFDTAAASDGRSKSGRARYGVQRWHRVDLH